MGKRWFEFRRTVRGLIVRGEEGVGVKVWEGELDMRVCRYVTYFRG